MAWSSTRLSDVGQGCHQAFAQAWNKLLRQGSRLPFKRFRVVTRETDYYCHLLVDRVPSMLAYWDSSLHCCFANRAYERWFGVPPGSLVGTSLRDLLGPELFALTRPYIEGALRGREQVFERVTPGPDGAMRNSQATFIPDVREGRTVGFLVLVTEITGLKRTEDALRAEMAERSKASKLLQQRESALKEAQRLGQIGSFEWDLSSDMPVWSEGLYRIFGRDPELPPLGYSESAKLFTPQSWSELQAAIDRARRTGEPYALEVEYIRPDGRSGWLEVRSEAVRDEAGQVVGLRGAVLEITLRRQAQEARMQRDVAEAANRNKTMLLSRVSHELRTPLNAILGFAQISQADPELGDKQRHWAELIQQAGTQMLELVEEMLDLSGAEMGKIAVRLERVDLVATAREGLSQLSVMASGARVSLVDRLPAYPLHVHADPRRVRQILDNLVTNAIKYNRTEGQVVVSAAHLGDAVEVSVADTGSGLTQSQLSRLFTPFDRLGAEYTGVKGAGIGLALSKKLLELMGGSIHVESWPDAGSRFVATLPAWRA